MSAIRYNVGSEQYVILNSGASMPESEYSEIQDRDEQRGYADRITGYYDKWYRYHRSDDGAAYDRGVQRAIREKHCSPSCHIIECTGC